MATAQSHAATRLDSRRARERDIVDATRALFDERGMQDAPIEQIAAAVGINKALIYRHFSSKEELFVLTVTRYLAEITERFGAVDPEGEPVVQLRQAWESFAGYCLEHPAFLDCALSLMRQPARELHERVSEGVWFRLGQAMAESLRVSSQILARGAEQGVFDVEDPDLTAAQLYTQTLGTMHLARSGVGVREAAPGVPTVFRIDSDAVTRMCVDAALATVGARGKD
ncbi:MAG TPA: TetR/AcrR family transcriptional regulator [Solirubrobacteraceae bacterium]